MTERRQPTRGPLVALALAVSITGGCAGPTPVRHTLEQQYARMAEAYMRRTPAVVLALRTRDFSVVMPNGERWDADQSATYVIAGFEQMERTLSVSFSIRELDVRGDTAAAFIHQRWARMQMKGGQVRRVETTACQRETWVDTAAGWRLHLIDSIQPLVWTVDGKRVDPGRPYDPLARPYAPEVEPESRCTPQQHRDADSIAMVRRELEARYSENEAGFIARDVDRVMRLRHPDFHTITPDGAVSSREQMYERTRAFIARVERFDSLSETITSLTLAGDTAHGVILQRTARQQRLPDGQLHEVRTWVVQRESWIRTPQGWLFWRVDRIHPGVTLLDGRIVY